MTVRAFVDRVIRGGGPFACAAIFSVTALHAAPQERAPQAPRLPSAPPEPAPPPATAPTPAPTANAVVPPKLLSDAAILYPEGASGDATVILVLTVAADGTVKDAVPTEPREPFSSLAANAARGWRFAPATRGGAPIAAKFLFAVDFHAPPPPPPEEPDPAEEPPYGPDPSSAAPPPPPSVPQEVTIRGVRPEPSRTASLSRAEVRQIPGTFGDPFRAIEVMPGVTPIVSGLPFFFVRGAPPGDVGYFLDGIRVPLLFHVGVGPSVIHPGLMDRVDLYPGGYPARYGRFSGGIVAGETIRPGDALHGEYNARLFDAGALVETPFASGRGVALFAGRYSYTAALLSLLSADTQLDYWDYQARVSYDVGRDDRVSVFAFGSYDYLGQITPTQTVTLFGAEFHRVDLRYERRLSGTDTLRLAVTGGFDRSRLPDDRYLRDRTTGMRSELSLRLASNAVLRAGTDVQADTYDVELNVPDLSPSAARATSVFTSRTDVALGARADVVWGVRPGFDVTPGVRLDFFGSQGATAVAIDPRLTTRLELSSRMRLQSAMGIAQQPPAFVVPFPGFQPGGLRGGLQRALQESVGIELDVDDTTTATATVFHNAFFQMSDPLSSTRPQVNGCPPGAFPTDGIAGDRGSQPSGNATCGPRFPAGTLGPDRSGGGGQAADSRGGSDAAQAFETRTNGSSYGLELFLKRRLTQHLGGFLSYTLSRSERRSTAGTFVASFDRTHVVNAALAYDLGRGWRAGTRLVFYTGLPKAADPTDPDSTRLPPFTRIDLRIEKRWNLGPKTWISIIGEWMNATLSKEAISTRCTLQGCESQTVGPVTIPSIGVEGGF